MCRYLFMFLLVCFSYKIAAAQKTPIQLWHTQKKFPEFMNHFYDFIKYGIHDIRNSLASLPSSITKLFIHPNHHEHDIALVRYTQHDALCNQELEFLNNRKKYIQEGLETLLGQTIPIDDRPRIALCFSGGGFRSMLMTLGFLEAAENIGLLQASTYIASLSGSTWAIGPWIASEKSLQSFTADLIHTIKFGLNHIETLEELVLLFCNILTKIHHKQCISVMDIYGAILANTLLYTMGSKRLSMTLSESHKNIIHGRLPLPIYTAIQTNSSPYEWMEISPFEIGSDFLKAYIPTWAYGRKFARDVSVDNKPEQTLGYFLGVFGSAFAVNFEDILQLTTCNLACMKKHFPALLQELIDKVIKTILYSPLNNFRLFPSMLYNFTYQAAYSPLCNNNTLYLVDAGIDFNLPIPPLLRKARNIDIIIIYDASENIEKASGLRSLAAYAQRKGIKLPNIHFDDIDKKPISIFKDTQDQNTPIIVYFPRIKNSCFSQEFDPTFCIHNEYCGTFNFAYTEEQVNNLHGLASFTLKQHEEVIKTLIGEVIARKQK